jgi:hypothetical protein
MKINHAARTQPNQKVTPRSTANIKSNSTANTEIKEKSVSEGNPESGASADEQQRLEKVGAPMQHNSTTQDLSPHRTLETRASQRKEQLMRMSRSKSMRMSSGDSKTLAHPCNSASKGLCAIV